MRGHHEGDKWTMRPEGELERWKKKDPLDHYTKKLIKDKIITQKEIEEKRAQFIKEIEDAVEYAKNTPYPDPSELVSDIFYEG
jgi:pyruvate dehydrogenase E1 component alpha subunit